MDTTVREQSAGHSTEPPAARHRDLIVVDTETSGLRWFDVAVEVAWHNVDTGEHGCFIPAHPVDWVLAMGEPKALDINGYRDRIAGQPQDDGTQAHRLHDMLRGQALAGSNPAFDWQHLHRLFRSYGLVDQPHHRLPDLSAYAAGVLGLDPRNLPGLAKVCQLLGVEPGDHTAAADVAATVACFQALQARSSGRAAA